MTISGGHKKATCKSETIVQISHYLRSKLHGIDSVFEFV